MKRQNYIIASMAVLTLFSCNKMENNTGAGRLTLGVAIPETKAAMGAEDLLNTAKVNIYYADFSGLVRSYTYSETPEEIWLPANEYRVDVIAGEAAKAAPAPASWEQKSYSGSRNFTIQAGKGTSVEVVAGVSNAISKVSFDSSVADNFQNGYTFTIGVEDASLVYDASRSGAEGYFLIAGKDEPEFAWTFDGILSKDGASFSKSGVISGLEAGKVYAMNLKYSLKDGIGTFDLFVDYTTTVIEDNILFEPVSTGLSASAYRDIWAAHATVYADVDETEYSDASAIAFAFSPDGATWTSVPAERMAEGSYRAVLGNLAPETEYTYKLVIAGEDVGDTMTLTTDAAPVVPNSSFEETSTSFDGKYKEWYNASSSDPLCRTPWWGSGNGSDNISGSAAYKIICAPDTEAKVDGNQSACLQSQYAIVKFAAGNLFTGYFAGLVGTEGGMVNFGRPFTARPTALKFWAKYRGGKITDVNGYPKDHRVTKDDYDCGRVQIALGTWNRKTYGGTNECPVQVNTTNEATFVDYTTDPSTLAYGEQLFQSSENDGLNEWKEYTIPLDFKDIDTAPTHIIISCAASMYGDYFTGCRTAALWIDKMEFVYE
ncbi:MAG: PCMD domain-containing protein [Bacteroidales bacterium]|nr:PCMD domain-containing protein [Bacteroidales bacterium]